jgi:hypothetical protein
MTRRTHPRPRREYQRQLVKSAIAVTCPRWVQRTMLRNLRDAAHCRVNLDRAARARQIMEQIKAEQAAAERRPNIEQPVAVAQQSSPPTVIAQPGRADRFQRRRPVHQVAKRRLNAVARQAHRVPAGGRTPAGHLSLLEPHEDLHGRAQDSTC